MKGSRPTVEKGSEGESCGQITRCGLNATHHKPPTDGREDSLAQRRGRNCVNKSREDTAAHGLHHAHVEAEVSRLGREIKNPSVWKARWKPSWREGWQGAKGVEEVFTILTQTQGHPKPIAMQKSSLQAGCHGQTLTASSQLLEDSSPKL